MSEVPADAALDIGASSVKGALLGPDDSIRACAWRPIRGDLHACVRGVASELAAAPTGSGAVLVGVTGSGARAVAPLLELRETNEIMASFLGGRRLAPDAGSVLEIGGEHSKFIRLTSPDSSGLRSIRDFNLNSACSAGTGGFLEQEAHRLGLTIEEFAARARGSDSRVRIAGRCAVFAKTDVVHKHQNGLPLDDITYALCLAMAQCVAGELVGHRSYDRPIAFVGGVASNAGMARALRRALGLREGDLAVPAGHRFADAVGAALASRAREDARCLPLDEAIRRLTRPWAPSRGRVGTLARLSAPKPSPSASASSPETDRPAPARRRDGAEGCVIGIDVGSTTTNAAVLLPDGSFGQLISVPTQGQALAAVRSVLEQLEGRTGSVECRTVGVTGSGRKLIAELIGADFDVNEITAHAAGCAHFYPDADSVFDIGGQDSKFIRLRERAVVGFEMNKVCAAGTGSFLEEMAELLGLAIVDEFAREAMRSPAPPDLGERCTVFMASEIARRLQQGHDRSDLAAGLAYAVVRNYLARVVGRHEIGERIVFQGGVASNGAVVAALRQVLGRDVVVHRHNDTAGAIGAALLASRAASVRSRFVGIRGRDLAAVRVRSFECQRCANLCEIQVAQGEGSRKFFSGGLCDEYEGRSGTPAEHGGDRGVDLFLERERALTAWIQPAAPGTSGAIGIPRALVFHEMLPFWGAFFSNLGIPIVLSDATTKHTLDRGAALSRRGSCLPLKIAYGHIVGLIDSGVRRIFAPSIASLADRTVGERLDHLCPVEQGWPYMARAVFGDGVELVTPRLRLSIPHLLRADILEFGRTLGAGRGATLRALDAATKAQDAFHRNMQLRGDELLATRDASRTYVAVLSRSYTAGDAYVRLRLGRVLEEVGMVPVPMDMLRDEPQKSDALNGMYWYFGKRAVQQARARRTQSDLPVLVLSTFGCGPDAFIVQMLRRELGDVPVLELEVDEHSECNGVHTRVEAFRYSLESRRIQSPPPPAPPGPIPRGDLRGRRLLIPRMSDHAFAFAAAFRSCGVDAGVLPMPDDESIGRGRMALGGNECLPCACVVGDMLTHLERPEAAARAPVFFMVSGDGPCRLGQYPWLQRAVLNERGYPDAPIFNASQDQRFYDGFGVVARNFQRTAWRGTVAIDVLFRKWREVRARACDRGEADAVYRESLAGLERCIERRDDLAAELERACDRFDAVGRRVESPLVTIAVLGENYVRCNEAANGRIAELLENLGADVWFPSLCEWVKYTNWTARLHCRYERQWRQLARLASVEVMQELETARIEGRVRRRLVNRDRPSLRRLFRLSSPYVPATFEGETVIGVGRTIDLCERGVGGVIHVAPFGCMVGGVVETLCERITEDLGGFPILCLQYDGRNTEMTASMIEGFVWRAAAWQKGGPARESARGR